MIEVASGQRTVRQNRTVGGASRSQHLQDNAADIPVSVLTPKQTAGAAYDYGICPMNAIIEKLESRLSKGTGVYVNEQVDSTAYLSGLAENVRTCECAPFEISAIVMPPGLPGFTEGEKITGFCVARSDGRWLVYRPEDDTFYAFWGVCQNDLGAHGVFGTPLYCWSA